MQDRCWSTAVPSRVNYVSEINLSVNRKSLETTQQWSCQICLVRKQVKTPSRHGIETIRHERLVRLVCLYGETYPISTGRNGSVSVLVRYRVPRRPLEYIPQTFFPPSPFLLLILSKASFKYLRAVSQWE